MKQNLLILNISIMLVMLFNACTLQNKESTIGGKGIDLSNMDTTYKPGENFYLYAVGGWKKKNPIPEEYSVYGAFHQLDQQNTQMLKDLFDNLSQQSQLNVEQQKILQFYKSGMDTNTIEKEGITPLKPYFEQINNLRQIKDISQLIGTLHRNGAFVPFMLYAAQDEKNSQINIAQIYQGGLGLPDRDYYTENNEVAKYLQQEYKKYIANLLLASGLYHANKINEIVRNIYSIEEKLAKASMTRIEMRDPHKMYNKMTLDELQHITPNFDWKLYFEQLGKNDISSLNINQPNFLKELSMLIKNIPLEHWKQYFTFHLLNSYATYLNADLEKTHFAFYGTVLSGKTRMKERWKKVVDLTSNMMGEAVGKLYVEKYFPEESKKRMLELVNNLKSTFREHIQQLDWMTDETKQKALEKLDAMTLKIGYPDKWRDYSSIEVSDQPFVLNVIASERFDVQYMLSKIDKPVDRQEWHMHPQTVNAYYNPNLTKLYFPQPSYNHPFSTPKPTMPSTTVQLVL